MDHRNRIPVCPDEGSCLQKVISRYRFGHRLLRKFVMSCRSRNSKGRQLWTRSLAPSNRCANSALITVLSTVFRNEKWRIVGAFFAGSVPREFFGQCYGWPLAFLGTCEVIRFRTNSRIRFLAAPSPMPAKPLKTTSEAPRSEEG